MMQPLMRSGVVEVLHVRSHNPKQLLFAEDQDVIQTLVTVASHKAFTHSIRPDRSIRCVDHVRAIRLHDLVEHVTILPVVVPDDTSFRALSRYGGSVELLKRMVAAGFPVIIEKGYYQRDTTGRTSWMGHFSFITGYDEAAKQFVWQDSYPNRCADQEHPEIVEKKGRDNLISYDELLTEWRGYNYLFIVVYPPEQEADVMQALGPWADAQWAAQRAFEIARAETESMTGNDEFFAWFNLGTSNAAPQQYADPAAAYDQAFTIYVS